MAMIGRKEYLLKSNVDKAISTIHSQELSKAKSRRGSTKSLDQVPTKEASTENVLSLQHESSAAGVADSGKLAPAAELFHLERPKFPIVFMSSRFKDDNMEESTDNINYFKLEEVRTQ